MKILAIDMGWHNCVSCLLDTDTGEVRYESVVTGRATLAGLIGRVGPTRVVVESGPMAGWLADDCRAAGVDLVVPNTNDEPWRWRNVKKKTDRKDALKLARLVMVPGESAPVHVPGHAVRQWRQLIHYRDRLVGQATSVKNRLRGVLLQEDLRLPAGRKAWGGEEYAKLSALGKELGECGPDELWRGMVKVELKRLEEIEAHLSAVEKRLDALAAADERVKRLREVPGVGVRTAELLVASLDEPRRFGRGREVACYAGLTPRKYQSGTRDIDGRISRGGGDGLLRKFLVQAAWSGKRACPRMAGVYERVRRGSNKRGKKAVVAVARHLLVWTWAMLRDGTGWREFAGVGAGEAGRGDETGR